MGFLDYVASRWQLLLVDSYQHASMVVQCIVLATIVGVLVGVAVYRSPAGAAIATALSSAVLTIPSFACSACCCRSSGSAWRRRW